MDKESMMELMKEAVKVARAEGATEVVVKMVLGKDHQVRFSNSQIDINKQWDLNKMEIFMSRKDRFDPRSRINTAEIAAPTPEKIRREVRKAVHTMMNMPKSLVYWGIDSNHYDSAEYNLENISLRDPKITNFKENVSKYINGAIRAAEDEGAAKTAGVVYFGDTMQGVYTSYDNGGVFETSYYRLTVRSFADPESSGQEVYAGTELYNIDKRFIAAGRNAAKIAAMAKGGVQGKEGKYDLIMSPTVAANIFNHIADGANPLMLLGNLSPLQGKLNKKIAPEDFEIIDNALMREGLNSRPFDYEGTPSGVTPLIENGRFVNIIQNTSSAFIWKWFNRLKFKFSTKARSTGNSYLGKIFDDNLAPTYLLPMATNYVYGTGDISLDEMIEESKRPTIYLTSNWYTRFTNYVEGTFSTIPRDGIFLIENGEIIKPLRKIRLSENLLGMLERIEHIGTYPRQIYWWEVTTPTFIPAFKIRDCRFTTATQ